MVADIKKFVKEIRTYWGNGVLVYLFALVFIFGANRGERLYGDACETG